MSRYYSNLFVNSDDGGVLPSVNFFASSGDSEGKQKIAFSQFKFAVLSTTYVAGDEIRLATLRSSSRLGRITMSTNQAIATGGINLDLGIYRTGVVHNGAAIDDDIFSSARSIAIQRLGFDMMLDGALDEYDRWTALWEIGAQSSDPLEDWDIVATLSNVNSPDTEVIVRFTIEYV